MDLSVHVLVYRESKEQFDSIIESRSLVGQQTLMEADPTGDFDTFEVCLRVSALCDATLM